MATSTIDGNIHIAGNLSVGGTVPTIDRTSLAVNTLAKYAILPTDWFVHDAIQTPLPGTAANDDFAVDGEAFGTAVPYITTGDVSDGGTTTRKARATFCLPPEYVSGSSITIQAHVGMTTTIASGSSYIDFSVYKAGNEKVKSGSDLVTTSAADINDLAFEDQDFTVTGTSLSAGDVIDILVTIIVNDSGTSAAVIADVGQVYLLLSVQG
tara:strand:- start:7396 stop:8025 length:630 start_codon:yes stop_codon:yes gene_type:complete